MARRVTIPELSPISDINEHGALLVRQDGRDRWVSYGDMIVDVSGTLKSNYNDSWNAQFIDGTPVKVEMPQDGEVSVYSSQYDRFENRFLKANDLDWGDLGVNEFQYLRLDNNGNVIKDFISVNSMVAGDSNSANMFLRVDPQSQNVRAVTFDPDEFNISAQSLQGYTVSDLDGRYLNGSSNLSDVPNKVQARTELGVYSTSEADSVFSAKASNLNDLVSKSAAFDNIKQKGTQSYEGVLELSTSAETLDGVRDDVATTPKSIKDNYYNKQESNTLFLNANSNLSDLSNKGLSRSNLGVYSKTESDNRYLTTGLNLSDLTNTELARTNLEVYGINDIDDMVMKKINNLTDLTDKAVARDNLYVYSKSEVYSTTQSDGRYLRSNADDYINGTLHMRADIRAQDGYRDHGVYGFYDSYKIGHIWSMGSSFRIPANGSDFGNLYGLAYKHTNNSTGGSMAGSHQMVWCQNGNPTAAMGTGIWTTGNFIASSDIRLKANIEVIPEAMEKVMKLSGYTFDRTDVKYDEHGDPETPIRQTGVIAQEVLEVLPEAVTGGPTEDDPDGHYSVAYGNMVGLLIEAIKEQQKQIDDLKRRLD